MLLEMTVIEISEEIFDDNIRRKRSSTVLEYFTFVFNGS
jgi:hypothetical protein